MKRVSEVQLVLDANEVHTVRYTELAANRYRDFWR
jgi:hypothetical protein